MATKRKKSTRSKQKEQSQTLTGWQQIATFLGQPVNVAQRWAKTGMPVKRQGRYVTATPDELNAWLGREIGEPVRVATDETGLASELKRGLAHCGRSRHGAARRAESSSRNAGTLR